MGTTHLDLKMSSDDQIMLSITCGTCGAESLLPAGGIKDGQIFVCPCGNDILLGEGTADSCRDALKLKATVKETARKMFKG